MESKQSATLCSLCLSFSMLPILPRFMLPAHTMRRPSTYSPRLLITEANRIRLRTSPLKSLFCKGTSVNTLRIFCSPLATNTPHYFIFRSTGLYLVYKAIWNILSHVLRKVKSAVLSPGRPSNKLV